MKLVRRISFADIYKNSIFRATNKWIRINVTFKEKITLKDHKHRFRIYHNCFRAQTGVDIMFEVLKELNTTKKTVTRNQAIRVMKKFLKLHVIEDVQGKWGGEDFSDDSRLYRLNDDYSV